ncbi:MAG: beta-ketoacyl synthase chain length factor [Bacteroidales bacterium]|nr:beta-ketoacyl synthase chain length factor [Bacteroidales bacterium]MBQ6741827.1 beta-ketoacyl synthase chain length factor [Bacteroidales bacterium]
MRLWITGSGIVSALGVGREATLRSLLESRSGIGTVRFLQTEHTEFPVGEVPMSDEQMEHRLGIAQGTPTTRTSLMGMLALGEALEQAQLTREDLRKVAFVSGTTVGGMDRTEQYWLDLLENDKHNEFISTHDCGACTEMIADHFGAFASVTTLSTACSSAANAIIYGARLIENGVADIVVAGGAECITKFHLNGFNSLRILDTTPCRPFDATRAGLNLGEGAAFVVLESEAHALSRGVKATISLDGYGNACDAFHQTASSSDGEGAFRAMTEAIRKARLTPSDISYINAHGTGTPNNDSSESAAMQRVFGSHIPPLSSTKSFTGHTTSASGSIETLICLLAMNNSFIPPNLNFNDSSDCVAPVAKLVEGVELNHVLCNSFGFGGNDSSLLLSKVKPASENRQASASARTNAFPRPIYVLSAQHISAQQPFSRDWMQNPVRYAEPFVRSIEPDYKPFIPPMESRRMGRLLKRALAVSKSALAESGVENPDIIVTGTGLGCLENTQLFLDALCREGEYLLKPTHFMQSTHNTIGSLIAINMGCHGYNATYAHGSISFESALHDAMLQLCNTSHTTALVGAHDEMTPSYYNLLCKSGFLGNPGEMASECSVSVVLGENSRGNVLCAIKDMVMLYQPSSDQLKRAVESLFSRNGLTSHDIAGILSGFNGSEGSRKDYCDHYGELFGDIPMLHYKHLFGECYSASALSMYVAACCLAERTIPQALYVASSAEPVSISEHPALVLYNNDGKNHSLTLLTAV